MQLAVTICLQAAPDVPLRTDRAVMDEAGYPLHPCCLEEQSDRVHRGCARRTDQGELHLAQLLFGCGFDRGAPIATFSLNKGCGTGRSYPYRSQ